jgi:hypothetical protein
MMNLQKAMQLIYVAKQKNSLGTFRKGKKNIKIEQNNEVDF